MIQEIVDAICGSPKPLSIDQVIDMFSEFDDGEIKATVCEAICLGNIQLDYNRRLSAPDGVK